jgi:hypothetical protein
MAQRVSVTGFVRVSIVYIVIATLALFGSYAIGVSPIYFLVDPVIAVASGFFAQRIMKQRLIFWRTNDGTVYYKGGSVLILIYAALLSLRVGIEFFYFGGSFFVGASSNVGQNAVFASIIVDALLMVSIGLLMGRNILVIKTYSAIKTGRLDVPIRQQM